MRAADGESAGVNRQAARQLLRQGIMENDLGLKEAASRISRSVCTVKRALNGSMGERTAYRILKEFGAPASRRDA